MHKYINIFWEYTFKKIAMADIKEIQAKATEYDKINLYILKYFILKFTEKNSPEIRACFYIYGINMPLHFLYLSNEIKQINMFFFFYALLD